jgi:2-C-methyl-D-erythritol 4-phosphate cytidylyltransferase
LTSVTAVIAAAGSGERLGAGGPKAFVPLAGRPMVEWSVAAMRAAAGVRSIVVACPPGHVHDLGGHDLGMVDGGATRAQSVANALAAVGTELVAIHDAARPLVTPALVEGVVATLAADAEADGAIAPPPSPTPSSESRRAEPTADHLVGANRSARGRRDRRSARALGGANAAVFRVEALRGAAGDPRVAARPTRRCWSRRRRSRADPPRQAENLKVTTPLDLGIAELSCEGERSVLEQTQTSRGEAELADAEGDAEADGAQGRGDRGADREGAEQDAQLAGHRPCGATRGAGQPAAAGVVAGCRLRRRW